MAKPVNKSIDKFIEKKLKEYVIKDDSGVTVITCTNLPDSLDNILANFYRQDFEEKELIIIINNNQISIDKWKERVIDDKNIRVFQLNEDISLGGCLNFGVQKANRGIIAKFDDDDYYGPKYLSDTIKYFDLTDAKLIGKGATFIYLVESKILTIRNLYEENKYDTFVNGSTQVFKKEIFKKVRFRDVSVGEDVAFFDDCIRNRIKVYSCNRYHHVYIRHPSKNRHTWRINDNDLIDLCCNVDEFSEYVEDIDDLGSYVDV